MNSAMKHTQITVLLPVMYVLRILSIIAVFHIAEIRGDGWTNQDSGILNSGVSHLTAYPKNDGQTKMLHCKVQKCKNLYGTHNSLKLCVQAAYFA